MGAAGKMQHEHAVLDRSIAALETSLREANHDEVLAAWHELEARIRRHLSFEEVSAIPRFRVREPEAADQIEEQHDELRSLLRACRKALIDGNVDHDSIRMVLQKYRVHQLMEDTTMYRWLREHERDAD